MNINTKKELNMLYKKYKLLRPCDVVNFAKSTKTSLHNHFEWSDSKAAKEYRLHQARQLITVYVTVVDETQKPIQAFVSLKSDRIQPGGGYRLTVDVLSNQNLREELLEQAIDEAKAFKIKYQELKELVLVFQAIDEIDIKTAARKRKKTA